MATHYVVVVVIVEFNFETKFCAVCIMLMILYFGKLKFKMSRAICIFASFLIDQWFPIITYLKKFWTHFLKPVY